MKEKILVALKTKYSNLGFGAKALDGVASILEKSVTDESQIETAVSGVEPFLKVFQSDADRARTEYNALKGLYDELKAKSEASPANGGGQGKKNEPDDEEPAWFKAYKKQQEERYNAIKAESDTLKAEKAKNDRANLISAKAKELGIPEWRMKEGFVIADDADEKTIGDYLANVQKNLVTAGLEGKGSGFPMSTPEAQGKELARRGLKHFRTKSNQNVKSWQSYLKKQK